MSDFRMEPVEGVFSGVIAPPGSKSLTNRALVLAVLGGGGSTLSNVLFADVRGGMFEGVGGRISISAAEIFCGNSGTTIRFLTAVCALGRGTYVLDGVARMRQRPIGELIELLRNMAVRVESVGVAGYPPVKVEGHGLVGGIVKFGAAKSSQFLSAALMIAPYAKHEVCVELAPGQTSWPYVVMTRRMRDEFGGGGG